MIGMDGAGSQVHNWLSRRFEPKSARLALCGIAVELDAKARNKNRTGSARRQALASPSAFGKA